MRETRLSGSEGGGAEQSALPTPISSPDPPLPRKLSGLDSRFRGNDGERRDDLNCYKCRIFHERP